MNYFDYRIKNKPKQAKVVLIVDMPTNKRIDLNTLHIVFDSQDKVDDITANFIKEIESRVVNHIIVPGVLLV